MNTTRLADFGYHVPITTRWSDNDVYGHINNVTFYSYFDSAANHFLITRAGLDIASSPAIALVVESGCTYLRPLAYPQAITAGVRVDKLGTRSVTWGIAIFADGNELPAAVGHFVHVFVDRQTRRAAEIPPAMRTALESLSYPRQP